MGVALIGIGLVIFIFQQTHVNKLISQEMEDLQDQINELKNNQENED